MIDNTLLNSNFQSFFVSKEQSNCPLISDVVRIIKKIKDEKLINDEIPIVSLTYGKRMLINRENANIKDLNQNDFLEIADYDPIKKIALVMGQKKPHIETPVHWLIHHAREDVNVIVQINNDSLSKKLSEKISVTDKVWPSGTLELAKEILKKLRNNKNIVIKDKGIMFTGSSLIEVENKIVNIFDGI